MPKAMSAAGFIKAKRGVVPRPRRQKGFPLEPRVPLGLKPPGSSDEDLFQERLTQIRGSKYPVITTPEFRVYEWLQGYYHGGEGRLWDYTVPALVSSSREGGIDIDFVIHAEGRLAWQVQGEYFHFATPEQEAGDLEERLLLSGAGYEVINLLATMINADVNRVCTAALHREQLYDDPILGGSLPPFPKQGA